MSSVEPEVVPSAGLSPVALQAEKQWNAGDRPVDWQGAVYGLVVHTTGGSLPAGAQEQGIYHTVHAVNWYTNPKSHGCHYVNGWRGAEGGDLLQVANENEQAVGVGMSNPSEPAKDQRASVEAGRFESDLPAVLVRLWRERWPGREHSLELLPGTRTANSCYIHVECVPCVYHFGGKLITADGAEPLRAGLRFTKEQHDTVALLAVDIARRNGWPADEQWWRTPRLLGHEDLTPIARCDPNGGWDPGWLRERPYFDWDYVYERIEQLLRDGGGVLPEPAEEEGGSLFDLLGEGLERFRELIVGGQELQAVDSAIESGVLDENKLANLVFFSRHPELGERKIQPHEHELAQEWREIRDQIVRPALAGQGQPTG